MYTINNTIGVTIGPAIGGGDAAISYGLWAYRSFNFFGGRFIGNAGEIKL